MKLVIDDGKKRAKKQLSESKFLHVRMYICVGDYTGCSVSISTLLMR